MAVVERLLDSDPLIRWQVMHDLTEGPEEVVVAERFRGSRPTGPALVRASSSMIGVLRLRVGQ